MKNLEKNGVIRNEKGQFIKGHKRLNKKVWVSGNIPWNKGKKLSNNIKQKIKETNKAKGIEPKIKFIGFGINHPRWKGGVNSESRMARGRIEFRLWRESVFARDNWTCQKYGIKGGVLHPHHIKNFSEHKELRFAIDNGITLSKKAHMEFHKKYGTKNNTKEQLNEFLNQNGKYKSIITCR